MTEPAEHGDNSAARLASLLDSAMDAIVSVDEAQRIVLYNRAAERIFGWPLERALGEPLTLLIPERFHANHNAFVRRFGTMGVTSRRMSGSSVVYGRRENGEEFPVDASISQIDTPDGRLFTVILRDVTDRVESEREQARLASRLSGLLDSAMDGILTIDEGHRIVQYNRAAERIFGWPSVQVMGRSIDMLLPQRFRSTHRANVTRFAATGVSSRQMGSGMLIHGLRAGGVEFPMEASISQIVTDEGKLFTVILRDVTERVRAQEELAAFAAEAAEAREQEKSRIARELHDELAQSLTALKLDVSWLRDFMGTDPAGAGEKLEAMARLLESSVAATRRIASDLRPLVLDDLGLEAALEWLAETFAERAGIPCDVQVDGSLELGERQSSAIFRIVQEALANIAKHARATRAEVLLAPTGDDLLGLTMRDDGVGFAPGAPRKPESLGLAGLRERANLIAGRLHIDSAPGRGTVIDLRIPVRA